MKKQSILLLVFLSAVFIIGCSVNVQESTSTRPHDLSEYRAAIIAYIDSHPGFFIGRPSSSALKNEQITQLESTAKESTYAFGEFIIYPDKMRFQANYGDHGPEPYLYEGKFNRGDNGRIGIGEVELTRFHVRPQGSGQQPPASSESKAE